MSSELSPAQGRQRARQRRDAGHARPRIAPLAHAHLSPRDRDILGLVRRKLGGVTDFSEALRALREAVEERIPAGRVYLLGSEEGSPVVGSIISGVGIFERAEGVLVTRISASGRREILGRLCP